MTQLVACNPCGAQFLPRRRQQRSCSVSCAREARRRPPRNAVPLQQKHYLVLRLLNVQPLERRARGGWRFGVMTISDMIVARLIASGRAEIRGAQLHRKGDQ